ncbi:MAG TPA: FAD-linked oxidase C-terminal domain-containing protein, partial [Gemmatimonadaceae bacterium]
MTERAEVRSLSQTRILPLANTPQSNALALDLAGLIRGEVRFDDGARALYSTDASNYRQLPIGVVVPRDIDDVVMTLDICRRHSVPVVSRGGGTSLAGQTANHAVVIDFSKYVHNVLHINQQERYAIVEPGVVLDDLRNAAEAFGLTFGPDPATHNRCTLGGMIGNNSCGIHSVMAGCTAANIEELDLLTWDGTRMTVGTTSHAELERRLTTAGREAVIYRSLHEFRTRYDRQIREGFPDIARRVSGYNLPALLPENGFHVAQSLVGSEGTLVTLLRAKVTLVPSPPHRILVVLGYPSVFDAGDHILDVLEAGPIGLEGMDDVLVEAMKRKHLHPRGVRILPDGNGWLLAEFGGNTRAEALERASALATRLRRLSKPPAIKVVESEAEAEIIWTVRESGLGATARVPGEGRDTWEGWEDASVPVKRLGDYLRDFRALLNRYDYHAALYGHFGQGCVHTRIPFDLRSAAGIATFRAFVEEAADLVVRYGGSLSGEHGDGQSRAELLPKMYNRELMQAFAKFKAIWDPENRMNPGKLVAPYRLDENLRLGGDYQRPDVETHFRFPDDRNSFAYATERCVGVGECRRLDGGTMCPSFMVTREEAHSTRGRAHLLFETMRGGIREGWKSDEVREALDLCLSCKGCKSDCPVEVDVATYKAEYLSHYYEGRLRPRSAYAFGLIHWWIRLAARMPRVANFVTHAPGLSRAVKFIGGIAAEREIPAIATTTFRSWWRRRKAKAASGPDVLLWVDTFNDHWQPSVLQAAVEVLEDAGCHVLVPTRSLCCGRPLYDYGMLDQAKRMLRNVMGALRSQIRSNVPIVGLEPSCVAVFRDELGNLFPDDPDARALGRLVMTLDEFLLSPEMEWEPPPIETRILLHGHCHQKAIMTVEPEVELLRRAGSDVEVLDAGCCGMAGGFGYEHDHYAVSVACGERRLLPAVRQAP